MAFDRTLVQIRERPLLDVLDLGFVVLRNRPWPLLLAALAGIAPFALLNCWVLQPSPDLSPLAVLVLLTFEAPLATAPLTVVLGDLMFDRRPRVGRIAATLARGAIPLLLVQGVLRTTLLFSTLFAPVVPAYLPFSSEVILLERGRFWRILSRSSTLGTDRRGELILLGLIEVTFGAAFAFSVWVGGGTLAKMVLGRTPGWDMPEWFDLTDLRFQLAFWCAATFFAVARFLVYIDQRIRLEGWEVELRLRAVGRAMEEAAAW